MNKDVSPIESGLMPFVRMKKQADFIGKSALQERLKIPMTSEIVMMKVLNILKQKRKLAPHQVDTDSCDPEGDESVLVCGKAVGDYNLILSTHSILSSFTSSS